MLSSAGQNRRTTATRHHLHVESKNGTNGLASGNRTPEREDRVAGEAGEGMEGRLGFADAGFYTEKG